MEKNAWLDAPPQYRATDQLLRPQNALPVEAAMGAPVVTVDMVAGTVRAQLIHTFRREAAAVEAAAVVDRGAAVQSRVGPEPVQLCGTRRNKCNRSRPFAKMLRT